MDRVSGIIHEMIAQWEGGFSNHPADRGGPTNMGITQAVLSEYIGRPATVEEVRLLTRAQAVAIYRRRYWNATRIEQLPEPLQAAVFDTAVNMGPATAVKLLQAALGSLGRVVSVDGVVGKGTSGVAARAVADLGAARVVNAFCDLRRQRYLAIIAADPSQNAFQAGWLRRCDSFRIKEGECAHA